MPGTSAKTPIFSAPARPDGGALSAASYVPRILVEQIRSRPERDQPWCEWVEGTLVMADVSGFTALSERLAQAGREGAEWLTEVINRFFGRMLDLAWDFGGTTLTFGGDAILLLFYGEDHERRGVAAALRMLEGTESLAAYKVGGNRVKLSMSMGAHAGRFLTVSAGTSDHAQYLILGPETVRTAQAESRASSGQLAVTPELAERLGEAADMEPLDEFRLVRGLVRPPDPWPEATGESIDAGLLRPYLPPFVRTAADQAAAGVSEQEHRSVTVVFVNVLGVDDLLQAAGADDLVAEVQRYMAAFARLVDENRGYLVSNDIYTNGFKLIVSFGAPVAHEHDPEDALRFAVRLRDEIAAAGLSLTHRIGVNGGFVFAGDVGPSYRRQYTIMGDAVNLSARLMGAADPGEVMVSASSADAAGPAFAVRRLDPIRVKGKSQPIDVVLLEHEQTVSIAMQADTSCFWGRDKELAQLEAAAMLAESGQGRTVTLRGEAGMGKSRLAAEFERGLSARGWTIRLGRAYEHTAGSPYAPWLPVLTEVLGINGDDDAASRSDKVREALTACAPDLVEWMPLLSPVLHLEVADGRFVSQFDTSVRRERLLDLITALLCGSAKGAPTVIHLEDAHWADPTSLEVVERVSRTATERRMLVLLTERIDGATKMDLPESAVTIDLVQLSADAVIGLIGDAVGCALPDAIVDMLLQKTKGNPLFLQEIARSIRDSGVAQEETDECDLLEALAAIEVPDRVQGLLMSQIDCLPASARDVLRTAAVVGMTVPLATLSGALGGTVASRELEGRLRGLVDAALLAPMQGGGPAYEFRHALIQEVAYDSLPFARRRRLHHQVGEYIERENGEALDTVYDALAHHYRLSGDNDKTRVFALKAGDKAQALLANDEAISQYSTALQATRERSSAGAFARSCLAERLGDCYFTSGRYARAAELYRRALSGSDASADDAARAVLLLDLPEAPSGRGRRAHICHRVGASLTRTHHDYEKALRWLDRAESELPQREPRLRAAVDATRSVALIWTGRYEEGLHLARRSLASARRMGDQTATCRAAIIVAQAYQDLGDLPASSRYRRVALELAEEAGDLPGQAGAHSDLAASYTCEGMLDPALRHTLEALKIDERTGDITGMGITRSNLAEILIMRGDYDAAIEHLETAIASLRRAGGAPNMMGFALMMLSRALARSGRVLEAESNLDEAETTLKRSGATTFLGEATLQRSELLLVKGDTAGALLHCEKGLAEATERGMLLMEIRGRWLEGRIHRRKGDASGARDAFAFSEELACRASSNYERGLALLEIAELDAEQGRTFRRSAERARAVLEPTGAAPEIERARALCTRAAGANNQQGRKRARQGVS